MVHDLLSQCDHLEGEVEEEGFCRVVSADDGHSVVSDNLGGVGATGLQVYLGVQPSQEWLLHLVASGCFGHLSFTNCSSFVLSTFLQPALLCNHLKSYPGILTGGPSVLCE